MEASQRAIVVGGAGFVGRGIVRRFAGLGNPVTVVDRTAPRGPGVEHIRADLLVDDVSLPDGLIVLANGASDPRAIRPWTLVYENALATARLHRQLRGRRVILMSSIEVYGWAAAPLTEDSPASLPIDDACLREWTERAIRMAEEPCPPWRAAPLCRELAEYDRSGRWVYALSKAAQERIVLDSAGDRNVRILRIANLFGVGQDRVIAKLVRALKRGDPMRITDSTRTFASIGELGSTVVTDDQPGVSLVGRNVLRLTDLCHMLMEITGLEAEIQISDAPDPDTCGIVIPQRAHVPGNFERDLRDFVQALDEADDQPLFEPSLPVVVPPRPERPDIVAARQQEALWTGRVKNGNAWTSALAQELSQHLKIGDDRELVLTASGTAALRLAIRALLPRPRQGDIAVLPSFTFPATGEALVQMGFALRFCDVDPETWTIDPGRLRTLLQEDDRVRLVMAVDALGNPAAYDELRGVCSDHGVELIGDSAPALGALYKGSPIGTQADAHAFSMSFAKVVSAGGSGGALVVPASSDLEGLENWPRSSMLGEVHAVAALDLMDVLDLLIERRQGIARVYEEVVARYPTIRPQGVRPGNRHSLVHWVASFSYPLERDRVADEMGRFGIETKPYYHPVLHRSPLAPSGQAADGLPVTDRLADTVLALPMSSEMSIADAERVAVGLERSIERSVP